VGLETTDDVRHRLGSESPTVLDALEAPLLVFDDLGTEKDAPNSALVEVIFHRHAHAKPTWVTTWLSHEQRVNRYGEGFARRLVDGARIIDCGG
jgi:DNA replication protein DnaC